MGEGLDADIADGHNNKEDNDETWSRPGYDRRCEPGSQVVESGVIKHDMRPGSDCLNAEWIRLTEQGKVITITAAAFFRQYPVIIKTFVSPMYLWISPCHRNLTTKLRSITKP